MLEGNTVTRRFNAPQISIKSKNREEVAKFVINIDSALGISIHTLRSLAKEIGVNHELAIQLWDSGIHEAKILASMISEPTRVTENLMEK